MALLDVNALLAVAWDSHVHHVTIRRWFAASPGRPWATCPITEAGFVRVSSQMQTLPIAVSTEAARRVLATLRGVDGHRFLVNDVSMVADDLPPITGHRQVTDALLLAVARRSGLGLVTFDRGLAHLGRSGEVELLRS